ncbi:MAG: mechanosensitive ion channel family protein [Rhizobiales bacterium]|nr:mechanosensitive ion channel family protein [Hyphomicrobiales bacterium]NRB13401.1 mechanosensitive ion channel family protein [Hyphomicrobiales bacterium]
METLLEYFADFWQQVALVWDYGVFGTSLSTIGITLLIFFFAYLARDLFARFIISRLKKFTKKTKNKVDDAVIEALDGPLHFIPLIFGIFAAVKYLGLTGDAGLMFDNIVRSLIIIDIFWALNLILVPIALMLNKVQVLFTKELFVWLFKALRVFVIAMGAATILELWGIKVAPILASFGLLGVAVALGAQDLFKNLIASLTIMSEKRLAIGDWVKIDGVVEGTVENIGFRSTKVRRFDKAPVFVPNSSLADQALTNFSQMTNRRIYWKIGLVYNSSTTQLAEVRQKIEDYLLANEDYVNPPHCSLFVRVDSFNDSSIDLMIYCFTHTTDWGKWLEIKEKFAYEIKNIVAAAGTDFAFPSQTVYLEAAETSTPAQFIQGHKPDNPDQ